MRSTLLILLSAFFFAACGAAKSTKKLTYLKSARLNYYKGVSELIRENYTDSLQYFNLIKKKYDRFTPYYLLADMRIADANFYQEKFQDSITGYKRFVTFYPTNANVPYALYRIGEAHYKQIPSSWFILPATYQRDQSNVNDALRNLRRFILLYPKSRFVPSAKRMIRSCRRQLYAHEKYVMNYYRGRSKHHAVIERLEGIFRDYSDLGKSETHLLYLGQAYMKTKRLEKALTVFRSFLKTYPKSSRTGKVKRYVAKLTQGK